MLEQSSGILIIFEARSCYSGEETTVKIVRVGVIFQKVKKNPIPFVLRYESFSSFGH